MPAAPNGAGRAAAASGALFRARIPILLVALALTAAALALLAGQGGFLPWLRFLVLPAGIWALGLFVLVLSSQFALVALLAPAAAWAWWRAAIGASMVSGAGAGDPAALAIILCGAVLAAVQTQQTLLGVSRGLDLSDAVRMTLARNALYAAAAVAAAFFATVALDYPNAAAIPAMALAAVITLVLCGLLPPLLVGVLPFREAFVAGFNRAREWRARAFSWLAVFSVPRWSYAVAGMALVMAAVVYFDAGFPLLWQAMAIQALGLAALTGLLGAAFGDWRNFLACGGAALAAVLSGAWCAVRLGAEIWEAASLALLFWGPGAALVLFAAFRLSAYRRAGEPMMIAWSRALDETAAPILLLGLALAAAALSLGFLRIVTPAAALMPLTALAGALVLFPALAAALDDLLPRRRPLKELYRVR